MNQEELTFVGTFYGVQGKYELYLFPKSTEKCLSWYDAKEHCELLGGDLPTIGELQYIDDNYMTKTFDNISYWSSTEYNNTRAYRYTFYSGYAFDNNKNNTYYVRAVRRYCI